MSLNHLIRSDLRNFTAYSSARDEAKIGKIWLNANESPFPARYEDSFINRYPEKQPRLLLAKAAQLYQVQPQQILMSRGSDEVIDLLIRLFCEANKDAIMTCTPTFGMYSVCAALQNASVISVPLQSEQQFAFDIIAMQRAWTSNVKIIFLCSPNNPTGNLLPAEYLKMLCETFQGKSLVVVDEAYVEYASRPSACQLISQYENLAVLRTFSKAYGMAGLRLGSLLANEQLVALLGKIIAPYPIPSPIAKIALQQLSKSRLKKIHQQIECIREEKVKLQEFLQTLACIETSWSSEANFLLVRTHDAQNFYQTCQQAGIVVRNFNDKPSLNNCIRMTVGTPAENNKLRQVLARI